jgi:cytochrome c biogenesis protein
VLDPSGTEVDRQTISVNHPLRHQGVTLYQADWGIGAVRVTLNNSPVLQLPMKAIDNQEPDFGAPGYRPNPISAPVLPC